MPPRKRTREEVIALANVRDDVRHTLSEQALIDASEDKSVRDTSVLALRAAGATLETIGDALGISRPTIDKILRKDESQKIMALVREVSKVEAVTNGLILQRRYMDALRTLPLDRDHANAHRQLSAAFATIFDKAALAAGEATERTETKSLVITLDERRRLVETLRESQDLRREREEYAESSNAS